jgi:hypothetical protein
MPDEPGHAVAVVDLETGEVARIDTGGSSPTGIEPASGRIRGAAPPTRSASSTTGTSIPGTPRWNPARRSAAKRPAPRTRPSARVCATYASASPSSAGSGTAPTACPTTAGRRGCARRLPHQVTPCCTKARWASTRDGIPDTARRHEPTWSGRDRGPHRVRAHAVSPRAQLDPPHRGREPASVERPTARRAASGSLLVGAFRRDCEAA